MLAYFTKFIATMASGFWSLCSSAKKVYNAFFPELRESSEHKQDSNQPMKFHQVCGSDITLDESETVAKHEGASLKGIVFSHRPVQIDEKLYVKLVKKSDNCDHVTISFGYTSHDPKQVSPLPPRLYDDANKPLFTFLSDQKVQEGETLFFYFSKKGNVHSGINNCRKRKTSSGMDTSQPLWAICVLGNSTTIELVHRQLARDSEPKLGQLFLHPLQFHATHGRNIRLTDDNHIATRIDSYCQGYVFSSRPIEMKESEFLFVQVLKTNKTEFVGGLTFGLIVCDPNEIIANDLPENSEALNENFHCEVYKDSMNSPSEGDRLIFSVTKEKDEAVVRMKRNAGNTRNLFHMPVEEETRLYFLLDLYGSTVQIRAFTGKFPSDLYKPANDNSQPVTTDISTIPNAPSDSLSVFEPQVVEENLPLLEISYLEYESGDIRDVELTENPLSNIPSTEVLDNGFLNSNPVPSTFGSPTHNGELSQHQESEPVGMPSSSMDVKDAIPEVIPKVRENPTRNSTLNECTVCYENKVDSVLYTCGHMCLCFSCAMELWRGGKGDGHCPICRSEIKDVIRTYK